MRSNNLTFRFSDKWRRNKLHKFAAWQLSSYNCTRCTALRCRATDVCLVSFPICISYLSYQRDDFVGADLWISPQIPIAADVNALFAEPAIGDCLLPHKFVQFIFNLNLRLELFHLKLSSKHLPNNYHLLHDRSFNQSTNTRLILNIFLYVQVFDRDKSTNIDQASRALTQWAF